MEENKKTEAEAVRDLAAALGAPVACGVIPYAVVPHEYELRSLSQFMERPARIERTENLLTTDGFINYFSRFSTEKSVIFSDETNRSVRAVLDYHAPGEPNWCGHVAHLALRHSPEWIAWKDRSGKKGDQKVFAHFIEERSREIVAPAGAEMLEIARSLQASKSVEFNSGCRLDNGDVELVYVEKTEGKAAKGKLEIPSMFVVGVRPFYGSAPYRVECLFRWRIEEGKLTLWYDILNPHLIEEDAFWVELDRIENAVGPDRIIPAT